MSPRVIKSAQSGGMCEESPDVNAWMGETTRFDRVRAITSAGKQPRPVSEVASAAQVPEDEARQHAEQLVEDSVLLRRYSNEDDKMLYEPNPFFARDRAGTRC